MHIVQLCHLCSCIMHIVQLCHLCSCMSTAHRALYLPSNVSFNVCQSTTKCKQVNHCKRITGCCASIANISMRLKPCLNWRIKLVCVLVLHIHEWRCIICLVWHVVEIFGIYCLPRLSVIYHMYIHASWYLHIVWYFIFSYYIYVPYIVIIFTHSIIFFSYLWLVLL